MQMHRCGSQVGILDMFDMPLDQFGGLDLIESCESQLLWRGDAVFVALGIVRSRTR